MTLVMSYDYVVSTDPVQPFPRGLIFCKFGSGTGVPQLQMVYLLISYPSGWSLIHSSLTEG